MPEAQPTTPVPDGEALLRCYLNDHRGAAAGGLSLARRCQTRNRDSQLGRELSAIVDEIAEDAAVLDRFARDRGIRANPVKKLVAVAGEGVGRFKPNGRLRGYSPLGRVLELEALLAGIDAKRSLWCALGGLVDRGPADPDFAALADRAEDQRRRLRPHHLAAARLAFGARTDPG